MIRRTLGALLATIVLGLGLVLVASPAGAHDAVPLTTPTHWHEFTCPAVPATGTTTLMGSKIGIVGYSSRLWFECKRNTTYPNDTNVNVRMDSTGAGAADWPHQPSPNANLFSYKWCFAYTLPSYANFSSVWQYASSLNISGDSSVWHPTYDGLYGTFGPASTVGSDTWAKVRVWLQAEPGSACNLASMNLATPVADPIPVPELACGRSDDVAPGTSVTFAATSTNAQPTADAVDTFEWLAPGGTWTAGTSAHWTVPTDLSTMPPGGWRVRCKVTRTVVSGGSRGASGSWATLPAAGDGYDCAQTDVACLLGNAKLLPGVAAGAGLLKWVQTPTGLPSSLIDISTGAVPEVAAPAAPAAWSISGALATVAGSGVVGWLAGGALATALDKPLGMDKDWLCRWNPGYKALNADECSGMDATPATRHQVQLLDSGGTVISRAAATTWVTAVALAEVIVNPTKALVGTRTQVVVANPLKKGDGTTTRTDVPTTDIIHDIDNPKVPDETAECPSGLTILLPWKFIQVMKCVLRWAFVPSPNAWSSLDAQARATWPMPLITEVDDTRQALIDRVNTGLAASPCWHLDFSNAPPGTSNDGSYLDVHLPTPSTSGCAGANGARTDSDNQAGDLFGYRTQLRTIMRILLYAGTVFLLVRAFAPKGKDMAEVEPR